MFNPAEEQLEIIKALQNYDRLKVYAYAGSGKTTTLKLLTEYYPNYRFLYLAFNSSIAKEARSKFPVNTTVKTTHSLAYNMVKNDIDLSKLVNNYKAIDIRKIFKKDKFDYHTCNLILRCYESYCYSRYKFINEDIVYNKIIKEDPNMLMLYGILNSKRSDDSEPLIIIVTNKVRELWYKMYYGKIRPDHNFYLKYFQLNLDKYINKLKHYDCILLDEAQDTNDVTLDIFNKIPAKKKVMVGDRYQKIYGFRGSIDAMEKFKADKELYLSISFRFNQDIANEANKILSNIRKEKVLIKSFNKIGEDNIQTTAVISRTNAGIIEYADMLIKQKRKFRTIRHVDEITRLPLSVLGFKYGYIELVKDTWLYAFENMDKLEKYAEEVDDQELKSAITIVKNFDLRLIEIADLMKKFQDPNSNIVLTTAHTAKGLEWDRVIILNNFPDIITSLREKMIYSLKSFNKLLNPDEDENISEYMKKIAREISEEINLLYVAITRAKHDLTNYSINKEYFSLTEEEFNELIKDREKHESFISVYQNLRI